MKIISPMGRGSGAYVVHKILARTIPGYRVNDYHPYRTLFPPSLSLMASSSPAPDIIHTTPEFGCFFAKKNIPLVLTFHNFVLDDFMQQYSSAAQKLYYRIALRTFTRKSLQVAPVVTSVSHFTAAIVKKELNYSDTIHTIYNGIDTEIFRPGKRKDRGINVLFSGNLTKRKGAQWLPLIADKLNDGISIRYTSGLRTKNRIPERPNLENIGNIPYQEMPAWYQDADILLFPTVREGFGLAAAEAMACGIPVVATNCSSLPELIIDGKGGFLCELGNVEEFAKRINELADTPTLRREMGEFNRDRIEKKFSLKKMIQDYTELFSTLLTGR